MHGLRRHSFNFPRSPQFLIQIYGLSKNTFEPVENFIHLNIVYDYIASEKSASLSIMKTFWQIYVCVLQAKSETQTAVEENLKPFFFFK